MDIKEHWENVYKDKLATDVSWYQQEPVLSLQLIRKYSPHHDVRLIDVGGGASTLCDYLLRNGYKHITVLDLSSNAITQAKERLGKNSSLIQWQEEDVTHLETDESYGLWH